jgi:hypothetical protein
VRPEGVVLDAPVLQQHPGLEQAAEGLDGQQLVAEPAAEALHLRVLPGRPGLDVAGPGAAEAAPRQPGGGCGSRVGDDQQDDHRVQEEAEHGDPVVRMALLGLCIAVQRGQHAQQDRQQGDRQADRDQGRAPSSPVFTDGFQRAEDRRGEHDQEQHP